MLYLVCGWVWVVLLRYSVDKVRALRLVFTLLMVRDVGCLLGL